MRPGCRAASPSCTPSRPASGYSDGCPTSGGRNETLGATAVIDWLNGRRKAYTTRTGTVEAPPVNWHNGHTAMMGTSYNGTIPIAAATTGVQGLDAIVPISAISDWYDYYRANGMVRAPHSAAGGTGNNCSSARTSTCSSTTSTRAATRTRPAALDLPPGDRRRLGVNEDRLTGNRNAFWDERNYMKDVKNVHAAALIAHGNNDFNVMTKNAAQFYDALKAQNVPHQFYFHQGGHGGAPPDAMINRWFTKYLWGQDNGVENLPKSWVVREAATCPPRQTTVTGDQSNTATLTVASTSAVHGRPHADDPGDERRRHDHEHDARDHQHPGRDAPHARERGRHGGRPKVASGAIVILACSTANPTPYAEWPDPASRRRHAEARHGRREPRRARLHRRRRRGTTETLTDDAEHRRHGAARRGHLAEPPDLPDRRRCNSDVRISGTPTVSLNVAFSKPKANLSAALVSYPATGTPAARSSRAAGRTRRTATSDYVSDADRRPARSTSSTSTCRPRTRSSRPAAGSR